MQQLFKSNKGVTTEEIPIPALTSGHILVKTLYSAVSTGTETRLIKSNSNFKKIIISPKEAAKKFLELSRYGFSEARKEFTYRRNKLTTIGYSSIGIVLEKAKDVSDIKLGDLVACGGYNFASHAEVISIPKNNVVKLPNLIKKESAAFTFIGAICLHAINMSCAKKDDTIAVIGLGLIGQIISRILIHKGCKVIAIDLQNSRVSLTAKNVFATISQKEFIEEITKYGGADKVIIAATAKTNQILELALRICKPRANILIAGNLPISVPYSEFLKKECTLSISRSAGVGKELNKNMKEFASLLGRNKVNIDNLVTNVFDFSQFKDAFECLLHKNTCSIVLKYSDTVKLNRELELKPLNNSKQNIAVVGLGRFAQNTHLPAISASDFNLYCTVSSSGARSKEMAQRFGANKCSTDFESILNYEKLDLVYITSGDFQHAEQAVIAANAKKAIFLEKPLATSEKECKQIVEAIKKNKVFFALGLNRRYSDLAKYLKLILSTVDKPVTISVHFNEILQPNDKKPISGAIRVGCHFIDLACWLLDTEVKSVYATGEENNFVAEAKLADGSVFKFTFVTLFNESKWRERIEIATNSHDITVREFKTTEIFSNGHSFTKIFSDDRGYKKQLQEISKALKGEKADIVDLKQAVMSAEFGFAVLKSLKTGKEITLESQRFL